MFIDEKELERRLKSEFNLNNKESVRVGEPQNTTRADPIDRLADKIVAGESAASISDTGSAFPPSAEEKPLSKIREMALDKLVAALKNITDDKIESANLRDLGNIASNISRVVEKLSPRDENRQATVIIYAPGQKSEKDYDSVDV